MTTTTIRVDVETHARLHAMSEAGGMSLVETVRAATEALRRQRFAEQVTLELEALQQDPEAWRAYLAEEDSTGVSDGLDR